MEQKTTTYKLYYYNFKISLRRFISETVNIRKQNYLHEDKIAVLRN